MVDSRERTHGLSEHGRLFRRWLPDVRDPYSRRLRPTGVVLLDLNFYAVGNGGGADGESGCGQTSGITPHRSALVERKTLDHVGEEPPRELRWREFRP